MDEDDLEYHLTDIDNFNKDYIDINRDSITKDKTINNIYNNQIDEPFHNFWFLINHCKFIKGYNDFNTLYFALNIKNKEHKTILDYLKKILEYIKENYEIKFKNEKFTYKLLREKDYNYPIVLSFNKNDNSNITNNDGDEINFMDLKNNNLINYSILFETNYFYVKDNTIYLNLNIITLQSKETNKKKFGNLNIIPKTIQNIKSQTISYKTNNIKPPETLSEKKSIFQIDSNILMQKIGNLKKSQNEETIKDNEEKSNPGDAYLEQKKLLKTFTIDIPPENIDKKEKKNKKEKKDKKDKKDKKNKKDKKDKKDKKL